MKVFTKIAIIFFHVIYGQSLERICATESMPSEQIMQIKQNVEQWRQTSFRDTTAIHIYVAWHIITQNDGTGDYSDQSIYDMIEILNSNYAQHNFFFTLDTIDRTANNTWFDNWEGYGSAGEEAMQALSIDPYHYMNIYLSLIHI